MKALVQRFLFRRKTKIMAHAAKVAREQKTRTKSRWGAAQGAATQVPALTKVQAAVRGKAVRRKLQQEVLDAPGADDALAVVDEIYSPINWVQLKSSAPHGQIEYFAWLSVLIRYLRIMGVSRDHLKESGAVLCQRRYNARNTLGIEATEPVVKAKKKRRDSRVVVSDKYKVFPALLLTHGCEADGEELGEKMLNTYTHRMQNKRK